MFGVPSGKCIDDIESIILTGTDIGLLSEPALVQMRDLLMKAPETVPKKGAISWSRLQRWPLGMPENLPNIKEDSAAALRKFDVIWAADESVWLKSALAPLLDDAACLGKPSDYFILRDKTGKGQFVCLPRR